MQPHTVLDFWFDPAHRPFWFVRSDAFDDAVRSRFADVWQQAAQHGLPHWRTTPEDRVAEIIVLDQFSRNLCRNRPAAFAQDAAALVLARQLIGLPEFAALPEPYRHFALLPLMHSESRTVHREAEALFAEFAPQALVFERQHKAIIDRFGRYPHRNAVLGRADTAEEAAFLQQEGSSF